MRILITRPKEDAAKIATLLHARGHETLIAPLLAVRFHDGPELNLETIQAVLVTSANGVRAFARRTQRRDIPIFAVGPQTEEAARAAGFAQVRSADGDAVALAAVTALWAKRDGGALLHAAGAEAGGRLAGLLRAEGFEVRTETLYDVVAATEMPPDAATALKAGRLDAALFFSPRSAQVFKGCMLNAGLAAGSLIALCISEAAAAALAPLNFREVRIATSPNQDALLACLN